MYTEGFAVVKLCAVSLCVFIPFHLFVRIVCVCVCVCVCNAGACV
jgi:hypothetical protein